MAMLKYPLALTLAVVALVLAGTRMPLLTGGTGSGPVYEAAVVDYGPVRKFVSASGPVRALVTVSVGSQLSGQISELKADFNSEVKAGDELAVIEDKTFVARVAQARADLAAAQAMLANQQAALMKAEAVERNARRLLERARTLAGQGIAATTTLDNATRDAEVAAAETAIARAQVENARATIAQREAQLAQAEVDLQRTRIRSPIDGTVIGRTVDVGQTVAASFQAPELFKIAQDLRRVRIEAQVSEADVGSVAAGNAVEFRVDAYPQRRFSGKVALIRLGGIELNNVVTYAVIIEASNDDRLLLPAMTAEAKIESASVERALRLPNDALRFKPRGAATLAPSRNHALERLERELERAKRKVTLTEEQAARVLGIMQDVSAEPGAGRDGAVAAAPGARPQGTAHVTTPEGESDWRFMERLVLAVSAVAGEAQRPALVAWKAERERAYGRGGRRGVSVWVLNGEGAIESRQVDLGLIDDRFAEILGDTLKEGDRVVVRSRQPATQ
jgi:HlyD family secretion protein